MTGPNKFSLFLFNIISKAKNVSVLNFTAAPFEYDEKADARLFAEQLCEKDSAALMFLAKTMVAE